MSHSKIYNSLLHFLTRSNKYILHCTFYIIQLTLYTLHIIVNPTLYILQYTLHSTVHSTVHSPLQYTLHNSLLSLCRTLLPIYSFPHFFSFLHFSSLLQLLFSLQSILYFAVYTTLYILNLHCKLITLCTSTLKIDFSDALYIRLNSMIL